MENEDPTASKTLSIDIKGDDRYAGWNIGHDTEDEEEENPSN